jgi:hypothetical protein
VLSGGATAAAQLGRMLEDERERERLRAGRKRPHKHLPTGLVLLPFVQEMSTKTGRTIVRPAAKDETPTGTALGLHHAAEEPGFERVTPELAATAQALRALFDVLPYEGAVNGKLSLGLDSVRRFIRPEVANAIRAAADAARGVWISLLIELVTDARLEDERVARRAVPLVGPQIPRPRTATEIYGSTERQMRRMGFGLPAHVNVALVAWVRDHLAIGVHRGGGKSAKLAAPKVRTLLADPKKCATAVAKAAKRARMGGPNS